MRLHVSRQPPKLIEALLILDCLNFPIVRPSLASSRLIPKSSLLLTSIQISQCFQLSLHPPKPKQQFRDPREQPHDCPSRITNAMDPATIIGTTSAILSFVQFTGSVILTAKKIHDSAHGATIENQTFQDTVTNFRQKYQALETNLSKLTSDSTKVSGLESDAKEELIESVRRCIALGTQIHALLDKVKASTKPDDKKQPSRLRGLFRTGSKKDSSHKPTSVALTWAALKTVWKEDQINALRKEWESCMVQFQNAIMRYVQ